MKRIEFWLSLVSAGLLIYFLWFHWKLGLHRYFDADEFAHLHWAALVARGERPYVDFLLFFPPGFYILLVPLFWLGSGTWPIIAGRVLEFFVFLGVIWITMVLFWFMRRSWTAVLAGVLLAFLPLPQDKFIEIRPDTLATLLVLLGMLFQIRFMCTSRDQQPSRVRVDPLNRLLQSSGWWAGVLYGTSILVLPKTIPHVVFAAGVFVAKDVWEKYCNLRHGRGSKYNSFLFFVGLVTPLVFFGVWALTLGNIGQVLYSLTKLPIEANKISQTFIMMPDLFFYPSEIFYGRGGYSFPLLVNHSIWMLGLFFGLYRLLTPTFPKGKEGIWEELLIAGSFMVNVTFYVLIVPLKHTQYLIPIAVFVAWFVGDAIVALWTRLKVNPIGQVVFTGMLIFGLSTLIYSNRLSTIPKFAWTNAKDLADLEKLYRMIPRNEYVLDLDGRTLYYPSPYPVCCLPFGQFAPFLSRKLPSLSQSLEQTKTKYISEGSLKRTSTLLPEDQAYIRDHYQSSPDIDGLLVRK